MAGLPYPVIDVSHEGRGLSRVICCPWPCIATLGTEQLVQTRIGIPMMIKDSLLPVVNASLELYLVSGLDIMT